MFIRFSSTGYLSTSGSYLAQFQRLTFWAQTCLLFWTLTSLTLPWPSMAIHGHPWPSMAIHGPWLHLFRGPIRHHSKTMALVAPAMAIRGIPHHWSWVRLSRHCGCLKMRYTVIRYTYSIYVYLLNGHWIGKRIINQRILRYYIFTQAHISRSLPI